MKQNLLKLAIMSALVTVLFSVFIWIANVQKKSRLTQAMGCMKQLMYTVHGYQAAHGRLPPAAMYGKDGTPLLSWRVLILPYIEEEKLYRQFKLEEPWDSPHNIRLLAKMPQIFSPYKSGPDPEPYMTLYQVFVGPGTACEGKEGLRLKEDFPRPADTIFVIEAGKAVPWTKPEDFTFYPDKPLPPLGDQFKGPVHVGMVDGSIWRLRNDFKETSLRAAILRTGPGPGRELFPQ